MRHAFFSTLAGIALLSTGALAATVPNGPPTPPALPPNAFSATVVITGNDVYAVGKGRGGALGVTSLTFSNFSTVTQTLLMSPVMTDGSNCAAAITGFVNTPREYFLLPAETTTHYTFPTPLVVPHASGVSCLGFSVPTDLQGGSIYILVNGFTN